MKIAIVGAGASGVFAALEAKRRLPEAEVVVLEKSKDILAKVRLTGGGRCNLTNAGGSIQELVASYPRGGAFLRPLFMSFGPQETMAWFEERGVPLRTEAGGRVFPATNSSQTVIDCLSHEMEKLHVSVEKGVHILGLRTQEAGLVIQESNGEERYFDAVILATGSSKEPLAWVRALGVEVVPQVPSLFTFTCPDSFLLPLSGISAEVELEMLSKKVRGPLLLTHWGFSGPAVLKLSSFLARKLADCAYEASLTIDWLPRRSFKDIYDQLDLLRKSHGSTRIKKCPFEELTQSLWQALLHEVSVPDERRWGEVSQRTREDLLQVLKKGRFSCKGMTQYKQEFVTAGGVSLEELDPKRLEAKRVPKLFFSGEILDIDGVTGGFNLQAAWTTGYKAACGLFS